MVGYVSTGETAPWVVAGVVVGLVALVFWSRSTSTNKALWVVLAVVAFLVAAGAILLFGVSKACEGAGGCMH